jgi:hypothetical protein
MGMEFLAVPLSRAVDETLFWAWNNLSNLPEIHLKICIEKGLPEL